MGSSNYANRLAFGQLSIFKSFLKEAKVYNGNFHTEVIYVASAFQGILKTKYGMQTDTNLGDKPTY